MNTNHKDLAAIALFLLIASQPSWSQDSPHWNKSTCQTCHSEASPIEGAASLRDGQDTEAVCEACHGRGGAARQCRHRSGMTAELDTVGEEFQGVLKEGKVVCSTCHDVVYQCKRPKPYYGLENPGFLRDRNYDKTSDYCLRCHETDSIEKLNPHAGVATTPPAATCSLCHESIPSASATGTIELSFNMKSDLNAICKGCHNVKPHPQHFFSSKPMVDWVHLVEPPDNIAAMMRATESATGIVLPLEPGSGKIFCATCHNPHNFDFGSSSGFQAGVPHRLRLKNICQACHDK